MSYVVDPVAVRRNPRLCTQLNGVTISLTGKDLTYQRASDTGNPNPESLVAHAATQEQLKALYDQGNPLVKLVQDKAAQPAVATKPANP